VIVAEFEVLGPFDVPVYRGRKGRIVRSEEGDAFFEKHGALKSRRGCYVFAMRAGKGITPTYVGKATKTFSQECFTAHKLGKCNQTLVDYLKGTLVMFLIVAPIGKGRPATNQITELEDFLIQTGVARNPDLLNVKGTKRADWSIKGLLRARRGRRTAASSAFKSAMSL